MIIWRDLTSEWQGLRAVSRGGQKVSIQRAIKSRACSDTYQPEAKNKTRDEFMKSFFWPAQSFQPIQRILWTNELPLDRSAQAAMKWAVLYLLLPSEVLLSWFNDFLSLLFSTLPIVITQYLVWPLDQL